MIPTYCAISAFSSFKVKGKAFLRAASRTPSPSHFPGKHSLHTLYSFIFSLDSWILNCFLKPVTRRQVQVWNVSLDTQPTPNGNACGHEQLQSFKHLRRLSGQDFGNAGSNLSAIRRGLLQLSFEQEAWKYCSSAQVKSQFLWLNSKITYFPSTKWKHKWLVPFHSASACHTSF